MPLNLSETMSRKAVRGLPKYAQLREAILEAIDKSDLEPGDQLPPDLDIVRDSGLSLGTVQTAMRALVKEGAIVRDQGRGTFVAKKEAPRLERPWYCCFSREGMGGDFLPIYPKLLGCKRVAGQERLMRLLDSKMDDFIQIDRLISVGDEFSLFDQFFLSASPYESFLTKSVDDLERTNFKIILRREYNVEIRRVARFMRLTRLPEMICGHIRVPVETIGLINQSIAYSQNGRPVFLQESYLPPNDLTLHVQDKTSIPAEWN